MTDLMQMQEYYKSAIRLYPGVAPGSEGVVLEEELFAEPWDCGMTKVVAQKTLVPTILPFIPQECNGTAVLVIPGGGFRREVMNLEGTRVAEWLNSQGIAAFVLKHRMPCDGHVPMQDVPLMDAQRALRTVRSHAAEWGLKEGRIGVMGFSAGGHLASHLATAFDKKVYEPLDAVDEMSARPDFAVLGYPGISYQAALDKYVRYGINEPAERVQNKLVYKRYNSTETMVRADMPPVFIMETDDDRTTPAEHSLLFYMAARRFGVPAELHIFASGSHGYGMGDTRDQVYIWPQLCMNWLKKLGFI